MLLILDYLTFFNLQKKISFIPFLLERIKLDENNVLYFLHVMIDEAIFSDKNENNYNWIHIIIS